MPHLVTPPPAWHPGTSASRRRFLAQAGALLFTAPLGRAQARTEPAATSVFFAQGSFVHQTSPTHPENPRRLEAVRAAMASLGLAPIVAPPASADVLRLCHDPAYIDLVAREAARGERWLSTGDTQLSTGSFDAALASVGAVLGAVDAVAEGRARNAFCATRPPGHHASARKGMGFCLFNHVALAARHAMHRYGMARVLIADWDVHHGNGTQDLFWSDGAVLFFDTHQADWYPQTGRADERGEGRGEGLIINRPFPAGAGGREILGAFRDTLVPAADRFRPDLVLISAGFDSRIDDPLGGFRLTDNDFADLTEVVMAIADRHAGGRVVSVLEGGYHLGGLTTAVSAHVARLVGKDRLPAR